MRRPWAVVNAVVLTLLCGLALHSRVSTQFEPIRWKVITAPVAGDSGRVAFVIPPSSRLDGLRSPVVVIAQVRNSSAGEIRIKAAVQSTALAIAAIPARASRRLDFAGPESLTLGPGDAVVLEGPRGGWSLDYLEIANVHGSSRGLLRFFVVPASFESRPPALWLEGLICLAVFTLALAGRSTSRGRFYVGAVWTARVLVIVFFTAALASPLVSTFKILIAPRTFVTCAAVLVVSGLMQAFLAARAHLIEATKHSVYVDTALVTAAVGGFFVAAMAVNLSWYGGNYSGLLQLSEVRLRNVPFLSDRQDLLASLVLKDSAGYDGQFAYLITFDPFLTRFKDDPSRYGTMVDAAPYRYGRIGYSLLTKVLSGDRPQRYPATMIWSIVAGYAVTAAFLALIFVHYGRHPAWGLLSVLVPGFLLSLHVGLPESLAAATLLGGYWCWLKARPWTAVVCFGASLLIRETGAVLVAALIVAEWMEHRRIRPSAVLAASFLPLIFWRCYVCWRLFAVWGWEGLFFDPHNMGIPFAGFAELWSRIVDGTYMPDARNLSVAGTYYPVILCAIFAIATAYAWRRRTGLAFALLGYALIAVSLNYSAIWGHVANGERGTYEAVLLLMVAWATIERPARLRFAFLGVFGALALYQVFASVNAAVVREIIGV